LFNIEFVETQLLGTIFKDPTVFKDIKTVIDPNMFSLMRHKNLYKMICKLDEKDLDITITNITSYFDKEIHTIGDISYIHEMRDSVASVHQLSNTVKRFVEFDARRRWMELLESYRETAADPFAQDFEQLLDEFERKSLEIRPKSLEKQSRVDGIVDWYEELMLKMNDRKRAFGMITDYQALDALTLGFQRSDFFALGARTSMGKSAFANELVNRVSEKGYKVAMFSLEMNKEQIYNRFTASMAKIPLQDLRIGNIPPDKLDAISAAMERIKEVHIDDTRGVSAEYITSEMRRLKRQEGLDFVIIDYLQEIVEGSEKNDHSGSALQRICQKIRTAAKECDCFVLGLSQLKQEIDVRQNKRPFISDLSGSASISAVADGIILLYRDEYYNPDTADVGILEVNLAKQRNGPTGLVKLKYDKIYQKIENSYF
jgi:replicative DNA helicase